MKFRKVYIEITNACNLACSFCSKTKRDIHSMTVHEFEHVIQEVKKYSKVIYLHVKGEPLLHPQLDALLRICDKHGMRVNITTNGTLLTQKVDVLKKHPCIKKLNVSLHCQHHQENYLSQVFTSIDQLENVYVMYRIWTLDGFEMNSQAREIIDGLQSYYSLSADLIERMKQENHVQITERIYLDKENEFVWPDLNNPILNTEGYCFALKTHIAILSDGTVVPCCLDGEGVIRLGNVFEESLATILANPRAQRVRKSFQDRKPCEELCKKCGFVQRLK